MNSICPLIKQNCCTHFDQMMIHKNFDEHTKKQLTAHYNTSLDKFKLIKRLYDYKSEYNLIDWTLDFLGNTKRKLSKKLKRHLKKLARNYEMYSQDYYLDIVRAQIDKFLEPMYNEMFKFRKGMPCLSCDWDVQNNINLETKTIIYKSSFCLTLVDKYLDPIAEKYQKIVKNLMVLDEWIFIVSGKRMIEDMDDRSVFKRYNLIINKCKKSAQIRYCDEFCREFNFNKFSYMFDGEQNVWEEYLNNFVEFYQSYTTNKNKVWKSNKRPVRGIKRFKGSSVFSTKIFKDPYMKDYQGTALNINFEAKPNDFFIERNNKGNNEVQIATLDNELNSLTLYTLNDTPVDLSKFLILFDDVRGIDFYKETRRTNIEVPTSILLALIHSKGNDHTSVNEHIENGVKKVIVPIKINKVADWVQDYNMDFKAMKIILNSKSEAVKSIDRSMLAKFKNALFGWM